MLKKRKESFIYKLIIVSIFALLGTSLTGVLYGVAIKDIIIAVTIVLFVYFFPAFVINKVSKSKNIFTLALNTSSIVIMSLVYKEFDFLLYSIFILTILTCSLLLKATTNIE